MYIAPTELDQLSTEEIEARIDELKHQLFHSNETEPAESKAEISRWFEYIQLLIYSQQYAEASKALSRALPIIDQAVETNSADESLRDIAIECHLMNMRFIIPEKEIFPEYDHYQYVLGLCSNVTEAEKDKYIVKEIQAQYTLLNHLQAWQKSGGQISALAPDIQAELAELPQTIEERVAAMSEQWTTAENYTALCALYRAEVRHYLFKEQPNETIDALKKLLAALPNHPEYSPIDSADVQTEIGAILINYKKYKAALPYLENAHAIYLSAGDTYEVHTFQLESLIEEALDQINGL
jgi:tetratricopeptide (TPR) repeat protein